jgi:predicted DNA-binding antitoxin AbrB/MazE fold protein
LNLALKNTMRETITAIYRNGALHPLHPLNLQDHQTVQIQLLDAIAPTLLAQLRDSGIVTIATPTPENAISDQELEAFVQTLPSTTTPTSQIIIEERGPW